MKMYFAGSYTRRELEILEEYKCPIMQNWSTVDMKDPIWKKLKAGTITDVIFDSGGFQLQTNVQTRRVINLKNFALWVELTLRDYPMIKYMALDKLGDNSVTLEHLKFLESRGINPIPIWHLGNSEPYDPYLEYYCDRYDYIAIGGIAMSNRNATFKFFELISQKYPHMNFHLLGIGLGISSISKVYRPFSADASSWLAPARWGTELIFDGTNIKLYPMSPEDKLAIRKNDDVRTKWSLKTIQQIKAFENHVNETPPNKPWQVNMFAGEEPV